MALLLLHATDDELAVAVLVWRARGRGAGDVVEREERVDWGMT